MASRKRKDIQNESKNLKKTRLGMRSDTPSILFYTECKIENGKRYFYDSRLDEWVSQANANGLNFLEWSQLFKDESKKCTHTEDEEKAIEDKNIKRIEEMAEWGNDIHNIQRKFKKIDKDDQGNRIVGAQYGIRGIGGKCFRTVNMMSPEDETFTESDCDIDVNLLNTFESTIKDEKLNPPRPSNCSVYSPPKKGSDNERVKNAINDVIINESLKLYPPDEQKILVLDAWYMNTAKRFYKTGVRDITIPNPGECYKMKHDLYKYPEPYKSIDIIGKTMGGYLESLSPKKNISKFGFTSVWLDFTSCFTTKDENGLGQQSDIEILLEKKLLASPAILAVSTYIKKRCRIGDQMYFMMNWFSDLDTVYCFRSLYAGEYAGKSGTPADSGMGIVIFKVETKSKKYKCSTFPISYMDAPSFTELILKKANEETKETSEDEYD
jgi:hypothetical protein